ncbi:hypothetical protein PR202_ga09498 [Eleusine coracana subsp. coracana]|uniref:LOB domain-containing protein n=1 Tax=Eleusine coracana subsp. coracana TaxID=191504 RepID=A0AAV5C516_ELECO|nr:hypothetical protein PR202_ga09498 [Eleusine coracana subsp. coracana]
MSRATQFAPGNKRAAAESEESPPAGPGAPCGACKFLRRRCVLGCVFAPHFGGGAAQFAAVHKVFGASNVAKMLSRVPMALRRDAASTVCYEAQARVADPVYGCVGTILALQHQVALVQAELSITRTELLNRRLALATDHPSLHSASPASQMMMNCGALPQTTVHFIDIDHHSLRGLPPPLMLPLQQPRQEEEEGDNQIMDVSWGNRNSCD